MAHISPPLPFVDKNSKAKGNEMTSSRELIHLRIPSWSLEALLLTDLGALPVILVP